MVCLSINIMQSNIIFFVIHVLKPHATRFSRMNKSGDKRKWRKLPQRSAVKVFMLYNSHLNWLGVLYACEDSLSVALHSGEVICSGKLAWVVFCLEDNNFSLFFSFLFDGMLQFCKYCLYRVAFGYYWRF